MKRIVAFACAAIMLFGLTSCAKTIAYDLGGGTVDQSYLDNADFEALVSSKPTKEGYVFVGWYSDAKYMERVTSIPKGSSGKKTLYANIQGRKIRVTTLLYTFLAEYALLTSQPEGKRANKNAPAVTGT